MPQQIRFVSFQRNLTKFLAEIADVTERDETCVKIGCQECAINGWSLNCELSWGKK